MPGNLIQRPYPHFTSLKKQKLYFETYDRALQELWPVPFEEKDIETNHGTTHLIISGREDAPPLFLLHQAKFNSVIWFSIVKELTDHFRVYCVDVLGDSGKSVPTNPPKTQDQAAHWLELLMRENQIQQADVAGLSYGGFSAINFALKKPHRVRKLILMAPAATLLPLSFRWWYVTIKTLLLPTAKNVVKNIKTFSAKGTYGEPILYHLRYYHFKYCIPKVKVSPVIFTDAELQALSTPTFVLVGDQEIIYKPEKAVKRALDLIPNCAGAILPECGHSIPTDQPELLARKMKEFLLNDQSSRI